MKIYKILLIALLILPLSIFSQDEVVEEKRIVEEKEIGRRLRQKRMAVLSCGSDEEIKHVTHASPLHDIGKIFIFDHVL